MTATLSIVEHTPPDSLLDLIRKRPTPAVSSPHAATPSRQAAVTRGDMPAPVPPVDTADMPLALGNHARYRVLRQLGQGGMGVVYQAEHTVMERLVALSRA